jgi:hypothetical protein
MRNEKPSEGNAVTREGDAGERVGLHRRGIFTVMVGALGAVLLSGIRPKAAEAHSGQITKGQLNEATRETYLRSKVEGDKATLAIANDYSPPAGGSPSLPDGFRAFTTGTGGGAAIQAFGGPDTFSRAAHGGIGVRAIGASAGVIGAVKGHAVPSLEGIGVFGTGGVGVLGHSRQAAGTGVRGRGARGIHGVTENGVGVFAQVEEGGTALEARGPVKFSSAGLTTIAAGTSSVTVSPGQYLTIAADSKVLCTLQSAGGVLLNVIRDVGTSTFTINLTGNATADVIVAWFLIS